MKQRIALFLAFIATVSIFIACNNDDNSGGANPILGTWKLVEEYSNASAVSLSTCQMEETWIFGPEQFTHELYENGGKPAAASKSALGDDDDDEGGDEHSDDSDDSSDDHSDDSSSDDSTPATDDSTDDSSTDDGSGTGGSGSCVNSDRVIGDWTSHNHVYTFTANAVSDVKTITFTDANNRFYIETTTTVNGTTTVRRYVYQKQ